MRININTYRNMVDSGLYCLINEKSKEVYIGHTTNFMIALERNISQITRGISPITELNTSGVEIDFFIIETENDFYTKLLRHNFWCDKYHDEGYKVLNKRDAIELACKAIIDDDHVNVILSNRNTEILVGVFHNMIEATEFINLYYPNKKVEHIIYATNLLSRDYIH